MVVIPAFHEATAIGNVVGAVRAALPGASVVVIDDGSGDTTGDVARAAGADVLPLPFNCGIGVAVQTGLQHAVACGATRVLRLDGDGQHDPREAAKLLSALDAGADCVIGSRFHDGTADGYQSSFFRRVGIRWFTTLLRLVGVQAITDPTSGLFAARRDAVVFLAEHYAPDYPEVDAVVRLARSGFRLAEVGVVMRARDGGISSIGGFRTVVYMVKVTVAILVSCLDTLGARGRRR